MDLARGPHPRPHPRPPPTPSTHASPLLTSPQVVLERISLTLTRTRTLTLTHTPDQVVLERMSFVASPGSVVALVGASGAGKSTVGRLLERFYDPLEGGLFLDGVDFRRLELRWLRKQIGLVEQEPTLF